MPSRRQLLAALAASGAAGAAYVSFGDSTPTDPLDDCPGRRSPRWRLHGEGWSPAVVAGGAAFVSERRGYTGTDDPSRIAAVDTYHGHARWAYTVVGGGAGVPLVTADRVYVGTGVDTVLALDRETGHLRWEFDAGGVEEFGGGAWGRPAPVDGRVVVGVSHSSSRDADPGAPEDYRHRVVALDADGGTVAWTAPVDEQVWFGPLVADGVVVVTTDAGRAHGLDPASGERLWRTSVAGGRVDLTHVGDAVATLGTDGTLASLDPVSGERLWRTAAVDPDDEAVRPALEPWRDSLIVGGAGTVAAVDPGTGERRWSWSSEAAVADLVPGTGRRAHLLYVLDQAGVVHVLDDGGSRRRRFRVAADDAGGACGWDTWHHRGTGVTLHRDDLYVTGPWVGRFETRDPDS